MYGMSCCNLYCNLSNTAMYIYLSIQSMNASNIFKNVHKRLKYGQCMACYVVIYIAIYPTRMCVHVQSIHSIYACIKYLQNLCIHQSLYKHPRIHVPIIHCSNIPKLSCAPFIMCNRNDGNLLSSVTSKKQFSEEKIGVYRWVVNGTEPIVCNIFAIDDDLPFINRTKR